MGWPAAAAGPQSVRGSHAAAQEHWQQSCRIPKPTYTDGIIFYCANAVYVFVFAATSVLLCWLPELACSSNWWPLSIMQSVAQQDWVFRAILQPYYHVRLFSQSNALLLRNDSPLICVKADVYTRLKQVTSQYQWPPDMKLHAQIARRHTSQSSSQEACRDTDGPPDRHGYLDISDGPGIRKQQLYTKMQLLSATLLITKDKPRPIRQLFLFRSMPTVQVCSRCTYQVRWV